MQRLPAIVETDRLPGGGHERLACRNSTLQRLAVRDPHGRSIQPGRHVFDGLRIDGAQEFAVALGAIKPDSDVD